MDLDFSFALVSSLTPHQKTEKLNKTKVSKKTNLLKTKLTLPSLSQSPENICHQEDKENRLSKELMNKNVLLKDNKRNPNPSDNILRRQSNENSEFSINMENVAVRRNRTRGRKNIESSPVNFLDIEVETIDESKVGKQNIPNKRSPLSVPVVINISSDIEEHSSGTQFNTNISRNTRSKTSRLSGVSDLSSARSSLDIVESSSSDLKVDLLNNCRSLRSLSAKKNKTKTKSASDIHISETSLSTAYDSDSFQVIRRQGTKVIPETPETDKSLTESTDEKEKLPILSFSSDEKKEDSKEANRLTRQKTNAKRKSSEMSCSPDESKRKCSSESLFNDPRPKNKSSPLSLNAEKSKPVDKSNKCVVERGNASDKLEVVNTASTNSILSETSKQMSDNKTLPRLKTQLQSSNDCMELDMFKLESTIKNKSPISDWKNEFYNSKIGSNVCLNHEIEKNISSLTKGKHPKVSDLKNPDIHKKENPKVGKLSDNSNPCKTTDNKSKINRQVTKKKLSSPISPKMSTFVLPSEVIPKFEHINQWLKDTQQNVGFLDIGSASSKVISKSDLMPVKNKCKVSLSPRIKKKKEKAKTSLEEEQKLFEELYGGDYEKKLSDDVDEVTSSNASCQDSVEFSENVLDKLYGTVWQKSTTVTQSEPRKGRKKKNSKIKTPHTERKTHRTSIYEVFSSSSSEDRFEEFLENVHRGKLESTKRRSGRPGTPDFINDSDSEDNTSLVFYQNIVSSAVKEDAHNLKKGELKLEQDTHRVNRRRLSFGSSKDDGCSESGRSGVKKTTKGKKPSKEVDTKVKKSRSKKKTSKNTGGNSEDENDVFSLVTPLKIKGKKTGNNISEKNKPDGPRSEGKPRTPKNSTTQKDLSNSEERLKGIYLKECDFKVPKSASKTFKTPSKSIKPDVPASPALSFLSSLSEMTAGLPCHPDALVYKKNFKTKREELTKRLFTLYNKEIFDNQLPEDMLLQWSARMTSTSGYCYNKRIYRDNQILRSSRIVLSTKILDRADRLRDTLIHELCHAATWIVHATSDGHGPLWRSWADKANRRFPELPVIKRCHDYAISTKFTYKCMSCGYCIGRHTKSLDTERKRCGFCFGKFQVFVTAKMSAASVTSGSDSVKTPRNPTGFALFVKENYAIVKKENNVPHAQVMKLLSQKFAQVKISRQNKDEPIVIE